MKKCPVCGQEGMETVTKDVPYTYKGETVIIKDLTGEYCPSCEEMIFGGEDWQRFSDESMALNKRVNAAIIDPNFVADIRKKLKLTQKDASKIFGGGPNAFSRYETGKALPPPSLVQLLRLLNNHPSLLEEIQQPGMPITTEDFTINKVDAHQ